VYDGNNLAETVNGSGSEIASYSQDLNVDAPLATERGTTTDYYEADGLGTITSLTASNGTLAQSYTYNSFGNTTNSSGSLTNFFRYTGREFDTETNLYYYRNRYYDPSTGRFLSEDPHGFDAMSEPTNLYPYVENNAVDYTDPLGLYSLKTGVPPPSPALDKLLTCMEGCLGVHIVVTATTPVPGEKHQDPGHKAGTSADIRPPKNASTDAVFCCAGICGAQWGINEGPGGLPTPDTTAFNYHFQLFPPHHPSLKAPNAIPPGCVAGGCKWGGHHF
jgi:RHS repeat-associated protein